VLACKNCHLLFDHGAFYVNAEDEFSIVKVACDLSQCNTPGIVPHFNSSLLAHMRVPAKGHRLAVFFPFSTSPFFGAWKWRQEFCEWKSKTIYNGDAGNLPEHFGDLSVSGRQRCSQCKVSDRNQSCIVQACASCCRLCLIKCGVHKQKGAAEP